MAGIRGVGDGVGDGLVGRWRRVDRLGLGVAGTTIECNSGDTTEMVTKRLVVVYLAFQHKVAYVSLVFSQTSTAVSLSFGRAFPCNDGSEA